MFNDETRSSKQELHRKIFEQYYNYVYAIVFNKLRSIASQEDIDDCIGDVFSSIYKYYSENEKYDDLKGFVNIISERKSVDMFRRLTIRKNHSITYNEETIKKIPDRIHVEERAENSEISRIILKCISDLGEPDSVIIMQKYYYNRNSNEISEIVSLKPSAVRKRCSRALEKLKKKLDDIGFFG